MGWSNCTRCIVNSHLMFQSHFDCVVTPMMFSAQDLAWMVAMWSGTTTHPGTFSKWALIFQQKFKLMSEFAQNNPVEICTKTQT